VRWPYWGNCAGEPDATDEVVALCRAALPLEEEWADPRRLALLWELLAAAADFDQQHDDVVEALLQALRYQRLLTVRDGAGADASHRPVAGRRRDADDGRVRRLATAGFPGRLASRVARDARPLRRGVAARRGAVEVVSIWLFGWDWNTKLLRGILFAFFPASFAVWVHFTLAPAATGEVRPVHRRLCGFDQGRPVLEPLSSGRRRVAAPARGLARTMPCWPGTLMNCTIRA
jgi:hypothetical protein